jgi:uncharacterized protein YhdP
MITSILFSSVTFANDVVWEPSLTGKGCFNKLQIQKYEQNKQEEKLDILNVFWAQKHPTVQANEFLVGEGEMDKPTFVVVASLSYETFSRQITINQVTIDVAGISFEFSKNEGTVEGLNIFVLKQSSTGNFKELLRQNSEFTLSLLFNDNEKTELKVDHINFQPTSEMWSTCIEQCSKYSCVSEQLLQS